MAIKQVSHLWTASSKWSMSNNTVTTADGTQTLLSISSSTGSHLQQEWSGQRSKHIPQSSQCSSALLQQDMQEDGARGGEGGGSPSSSLPPSPSSLQNEDREPDFLGTALISLEVRAGGGRGGGSGGIASQGGLVSRSSCMRACHSCWSTMTSTSAVAAIFS